MKKWENKFVLTWDERHRQKLLDPLWRDGGVRWPHNLSGHLVSMASLADPLDIVDDPLRLEGANDSPNIILFWIATTSAKGPGVGNVLHEVGVLDGLIPHIPVGELGPLGVPHLDRLVLVEELLLAGEDLLHEGQGCIL